MTGEHPDDHLLERYHLGMASGEGLDLLETHLIACGVCVDRARAVAAYVDAMRAATAISRGGHGH